jgi:hypothetical protein
MSYKFRKTYPEHAKPAPESAKTDEAAGGPKMAPVPARTFPLVAAFLSREWFPMTSGLLNLVLVIVLILAFRSYRESNDLDRKAALASHTPWLSIDPNLTLTPSPDDKTLLISAQIKNCSDTPMLQVGGRFVILLNPAPIDPKTFPETQDAGTDLMPNDQRSVSTAFSEDFPTRGVFSAAALRDAVENGGVGVGIEVRYKDIFGETIKEITEIYWNKDTNKFAPLKTSITGFTPE